MSSQLAITFSVILASSILLSHAATQTITTTETLQPRCYQGHQHMADKLQEPPMWCSSNRACIKTIAYPRNNQSMAGYSCSDLTCAVITCVWDCC